MLDRIYMALLLILKLLKILRTFKKLHVHHVVLIFVFLIDVNRKMETKKSNK